MAACRVPAVGRRGRGAIAWSIVAAATAVAAVELTARPQPGSVLPDGAIVTSAPCTVSSPSYDDYVAFLEARPAGDPKDAAFDETAFRRNTPEPWFRALKESAGVRCRRISYGSDGLRVTGFIVEPVTPGRHPLVIFNRGGTQNFGAIRTGDLVEFAGWALDGYVVAATQYRGNDGGEGVEQWGGADVNDIVHLATLARALPSVDPAGVYMYGVSRGGMMTYLALKAGVQVRAAATVGGPSDLAVSLTHRADMEKVYRELMPDYARRKDEHLRARSAVHWPEAINAPLLLLHGGADWRVWPGNALALASALQRLGRPYGLVVYEGDDHPLTQHWPDARQRIRQWFRSH